jgi:hypothetical protein
MQDVDRPADVQAFTGPLSEPRPRMKIEPLRGVLRPDRPGRISGHRRRRRYVGQRPAIRSPELERPVGPALDLVALFVHRAVMPAAE